MYYQPSVHMAHKKYQFSPFVYFAGGGPEKSGGETPEKSKEAPEEKPKKEDSAEEKNAETKEEAAKLVEGAQKSADPLEEKPEKDDKVTVEVSVKVPKDSSEASADGTKDDLEAGGSLTAEYVPGDSGKPHLAYTLTLKGDFASKTDIPADGDLVLKDSTSYTVTVLPGVRGVLPLGPVALYAGVGLGGSVDYVQTTTATRGTPILQDSTDWKVGAAAVGTAGARVQLGQWRLMGEVQKGTGGKKPAVYVGAGYTF